MKPVGVIDLLKSALTTRLKMAQDHLDKVTHQYVHYCDQIR